MLLNFAVKDGHFFCLARRANLEYSIQVRPVHKGRVFDSAPPVPINQ